MRIHLIDKGYSLKNLAATQEALLEVKRWIEFYDNKLTDEQVKKYCKSHMDKIMAIMPGRSCPSGEALHKEFNQLINTSGFDSAQPSVQYNLNSHP